jgi:hypothetical protein
VSLIKIEGREISDPHAIQQIVEFVDTNADGWNKPWYGIPAPTVTAEFYDGKHFKGSLGIGRNFFETQRDGDFWFKSATTDQTKRFLSLVGKSQESGIS